MKNKILSKAYGGVTVARRKLYGLGLPRQWKVITSTLLLLFTFAIGNVWGADFTAQQIIDGATSGHISVSSAIATSTSDQKVCNTNVSTVSIDGSANGNGDAKYIQIQADENYTISSLSLDGSINKTDGATYKIGVVFFEGAYTTTVSGKIEVVIANKNATSGCGPFDISVPAGTRTVRIYRAIKINGDNEFNGSGTQYGSGQNTYVAGISATATASSGGDPVDPEFTYTPATYTIGDPALDLSTKVTSTNTTGAITFAVSTADAGTTGASIASSKNFTATTAGTAKITVSQAASTGYNAKSQDIEVTVVAPAPAACPAGLTISGTAAYTEGQTISLNAALSEGNGEITYNWYKGADLATAKAAGSIGTGTSFSKASCTTGDAGNYFCVATKDACSDAESTAYAVTVEEKTCPTSGVVYSAVTTATGNISIAASASNLLLNTATHKTTTSGGTMSVYNGQTSGKNLITNGAFAMTNDNTFFRIDLECELAEGDVISVNVGKDGGNSRGVWVSSVTPKPGSAPACELKAQNASLVPVTYVVTGTDEYHGKKTLYIYRATSNTTYFNNVVITRPYAVTYANTKEATHTMPAKAVSFTLEELTNASYTHTGWTADKAVKVGGETKTAGTALAVDATVELTANTQFTATWEEKVTKYTVSYYNGEAILANKLGEEEISEGSNPTGAGLAPKKRGYTFGGWSLTDGGAAVALSSITVNEDKNLFVVWTPVPCPANGTVFAFEMNNDAKPSGDVKAPQKGELNIDEYLTETGYGNVIIGNTTNNTNQYAKVTSTPNINLSGATGYLRLALDCQLAEGDIITIAKNNTQIYISDEVGTSGPTGNKYTTATNAENTIVVGANATTAEWVGAMDLYFWYKGGGVNITAVSVVRPYTVSFNLNGQSATAIEDQKIAAGGKVTKPADPVVVGQAFGGWYKVAACTAGNEWDFANDVVSDDVELFAKWTALPKMTLNAGAGTGDDVVSYPTVGDPVAVPACPAGFEYTGYIFAGWVYSPSVTVEGGSFNMPNEDLTLTAQWVDATSVARIGSNYYATLADALDHVADGEIVLLQDIDVTSQIEIADGVTATIDLAGHKIEYTSATTLPSGVILVHNGGSLTINDSSDPDAGSIVSGDNAYAALALTKLGDDATNPATLVIYGGTFTGYYYALTGNGSRHNTVTTIHGGTFNATAPNESMGIFHPQEGTLTINNATITGYASAIEMRAGTLVINDGTFTATADAYSIVPNGSGSTTTGAAIAIAQHTTKKPVSVTINGGTFNGVKAINEANPQGNPSPEIAMSVTGGSFTGEVSTVDVNKFVSGGSFSEPVAEANCATGYVPETKANGKYGVIYPAQSIDFVAIATGESAIADKIADLDNQLSTKHYDIDGTLNDDRIENNNGFKVKKTGLTISFSVEKAKVVEITTGHISGASIKVDGAAAVAMESDKKHTYYSDDAQAFLITMTATGNAYNIFKSINIRDPYEVTFEAHGDADPAALQGKPSVILPSATNGTKSLTGWFTEETGGTKIGDATDEYTPTANITLHAQWEDISTDARLASITLDPSTGVLSPAFDPEVVNYTYTMPYGTADVPTITGATAVNAGGSYSIVSQASAWDETAVIRGVAASSDTKAYNITMKLAPKDGICIIKSTPTSGTEADVDGIYQGSAYFKGNAKKLKNEYDYVGVELAAGYTFQAGDKVVLNQTVAVSGTDITKFYIFTEVPASGKTYVTVDNAAPVQGDNWFDMPAELVGQSALYIGRINNAYCNPTVGYLAVYRPLPPVLNKVTVNGVEGKPNALKEVVIEVAASTTQSELEAIAYDWVSNSDTWTAAHTPVATNTWEFGVANTVTFTDKDGDESVYTITVNKAVPSSDATLSTLSYGTPATAIALTDGVYEYDVLLPYGTSAVPALAATKNHAGATIEEIANAPAFVDRKATSTVTVKAEDDATVQVYTVNFTVDRYVTTVLWDGSTMDELSDITALNIATADISVEGKNASFDGKNYTKCIQYGGNTKNTRYFGIVVPEGKVAKVSIVYRSRGNSARSIIIGTAIASAIDESAIVYATKENDTELLYKLTADIFAAGTIYINTTNGFQVFEIDVQLADGYARSSMLGAGVYGTVCVPNNVAVEDIQGVSVYEFVGRERVYGKLTFDEIVAGELEAGKPYVFQARGNHMAMLYGETHVTEPQNAGGMYGTFSDITLYDLTDVYYFAQKALWSCVDLTSLSVPANRAYVKLSELNYLPDNSTPAPGRRRISMAVNGEQVATGIENTGFESEAPRKVLINGEMFIIRGEKMYDAKGQLVK